MQEEVRRKIIERRTGAAGQQPEVFEPPQVEEEPAPPPLEAPAPAAPAARAPDSEMEEILQRQRSLETELLALDTARAATAASVKSMAAFPAAGIAPTVAPAAPPNPWLAQLQNPGSVRRAVVLREILGAPVGLR